MNVVSFLSQPAYLVQIRCNVPLYSNEYNRLYSLGYSLYNGHILANQINIIWNLTGNWREAGPSFIVLFIYTCIGGKTEAKLLKCVFFS